MSVVQQAERVCALAMRAGREERCPGQECPLWENGDCSLERMTAEDELADRWPADEAAALYLS